MTTKPFNILYLSSFGDMKGGGQESLFQLAKHIDRETFHPYVIVPSEGDLAGKLRKENIKVQILKLPKIMSHKAPRNIKALNDLVRIIKQYKIDIIHTDGPRNTFYGGLATKIKGKPLIWHVRVSNKDRYDRLLYHLSAKLILVAKALRNRFDWIKGSSKFITIYNGIDVPEFDAQWHKGKIRKAYGIEDKSLLITVVARIERMKGQKYLLQACGRLRDKIRNFHVLLVGEIADPDYLEECKEIANELGIIDRVVVPGRQTAINQILADSDIFVLPSLSEAFPRSLIEAMAAEKPVIATDVGGCSEAVGDKISGFLVPAKNSDALAERVMILAMDNELRRRIGKAARIKVDKMFSVQKMVRETERVYGELLGRDYENIAEWN